MTAIAERSMPIVDVWWDDARQRWTFADAFGCCPIEAVDETSAARLVASHFPGSSVRFIRGQAPRPAADPRPYTGSTAPVETTQQRTEAPDTAALPEVPAPAVLPRAAGAPETNPGPVPSGS